MLVEIPLQMEMSGEPWFSLIELRHFAAMWYIWQCIQQNILNIHHHLLMKSFDFPFSSFFLAHICLWLKVDVSLRGISRAWNRSTFEGSWDNQGRYCDLETNGKPSKDSWGYLIRWNKYDLMIRHTLDSVLWTKQANNLNLELHLFTISSTDLKLERS